MATSPAARLRRSTTLGLLVILLCGVSLRMLALAHKDRMTNDEGWSYLAASCNEGNYFRTIRSQTPPYGQWSSAADWQRFAIPAQPFCFGTIAVDLAVWDVHPPLYFWLLHVAVLVFGVHMWTGPLLNLLLDTVSAVLVFSLARRVLGAPRPALVAALLWLTSPAVLAASWEARTYPLLALISVATLLVTLETGTSGPIRPGSVVLLSITSGLGLLTHFHFAILLSGCLVMLTWLYRKRWRDLRRIWLAGAVGAGAFVLLFPVHLSSAASGVGSGTAGAMERAVRVLESLEGFLTQWARFPSAGTLVAAGIGLVGAGAVLTRRTSATAVDADARSIAVVGSWVFAGVAGGYVAGVFPPHAMGNKYLTLVWPFVAVGLVYLLRTIAAGRLAHGVLAAVVLLSGLEFASRGLRWGAGNQGLVRAAESLVLDTVHPGILVRLSFYFRPDQAVLAADQDYLLTHADRVAERPDDSALLIASRAYYNTEATERAFVDAVRRTDRVAEMQATVNGTGWVYTIRRDQDGTLPAGQDTPR